ncbi:MAG: hypothetical protein KTR31_30280 [Myxococcales bacterium]|nr:hypothetical protein [Myxococcales bacterium]
MITAVLPLFASLVACTSSEESVETPDGPEVVEEDVDVEIPVATYAWDGSVGDADVPAEMGGPGFTGEGWTTRMERSSLGNPDAPQGGQVVMDMPDWPATTRMMGKDWNTWFNYYVSDLCNMGLLTMDPVTLEPVPSLATHWKISEDQLTYTYRINPAAKWSDGTPVTAQDWVATHKLRMDPTLLDPSNSITYGKFEEPKAISKYILEYKTKEPSWRNFLIVSMGKPLPAHEIEGMTGTEYIDKYQFGYTAVNGAYHVAPEDIDTGKSITITRRTDWWAEDNPVFDGHFNIEKVKYVVVKNPDLTFEKVKKGEIDYYVIPKAQWWAEVVPELDVVKRGLLVRKKFYNDAPIGYSGIALNMKRPPLDDVKVRKALQLLYDRQTMIEKLYFNEYDPFRSYYYGNMINPDNELLLYDEVGAVELLEAAGWTELNDEGYRVKDGQELKLTVQYRSKLSERGLTIYQEATKRAGIRMELQELTPAAAWKNMREKEFDMANINWGATIFPNPETSWGSELADQPDNNNLTGFANARADEIFEEYGAEYDVAKRAALMRELDGILYNEHPYVLGWFNPAQRVLFWNKIGMPDNWGVGRYAEQSGDRHLTHLWWVDPEREAALEAAKQDTALTMELQPIENHFWQKWAEAQKTHAGDAIADEEKADEGGQPE